jgi:cyclophilin family peptidyl-prolyl cis-trans isomerase/HEAT repeat protein
VKQIAPLVTHARPEVRAEALNALGQALAAVPRGPDESAPLPAEAALVASMLERRMKEESDPFVAGVAAETLGRLPFRDAGAIRRAGAAITAMLPASQGAVKGAESLIRVYQKLQPPSAEMLDGLRAAARRDPRTAAEDAAFTRRLAWLALHGARVPDGALIEEGLEDPDPQVRRIAVLAVGNLDAAAGDAAELLTRALGDPSFIVRYDAVRVYSRTLQAKDCAPVLAAVNDAHPYVSLAAIDALGEGCAAARERLMAVADRLPPQAGEWQKPARALVSLARVAREEAAARLARFGEHPVWQVRMYAARAATLLADAARLIELAADPHDNVREAAVAGLSTVRGHAADDTYIAALARPDYQLTIAAARALEGTPNAGRAVPALRAALARITAEGRDTSRDARDAIVERLRQLGAAVPAAPAAALPVVPVSVPQAERVRITMARGGAFELRLFPGEAPATVARFVRLARAGYYNGLTFHRVVPNFVLQGGSPGANEYAGDGPYMRDELGLRSHRRGTLGISTRGRDTGDAQIFINLVDNPRLDHNYTVFADITAGMDVVDGILEGDVIERIDVLAPPPTQQLR